MLKSIFNFKLVCHSCHTTFFSRKWPSDQGGNVDIDKHTYDETNAFVDMHSPTACLCDAISQFAEKLYDA